MQNTTSFRPTEQIKTFEGYKLIRDFYGDRTAKRSGLPLINHIHEGLLILEYLGASMMAMEAFCIHPLLQNDQDLPNHFSKVCEEVRTYSVGLAMEYRSVANEYLSDKIDTDQPLRLSPIPEVNLMLIADKVQNRKDFLTHHHGKHERSEQLERYFNKWLDALGVTETKYWELINYVLKEWA